MPDIALSGWALLLIAAFIIGVSKTGFPGVGILAVPMVAMVIPAKLSTGVVLPMLLAADIMAVLYYRRHGVMKYLFKLVPCAVAGILIGYVFMGYVNNTQLSFFMGLVILIMLALNTWRNYRLAKSGEIHIPDGWWFAIVMGLAAGITTMMANAAGPIIVLYLLAMRLPKHEFLGTGAIYTMFLNAFKIPFSATLFDDQTHVRLINPDSLLLNLKLLPVIIIGAFLGLWLVKRIPEKAFTYFIQVLAAIGALKLLLTPWI
jgi:uncharacterized membrane protein YfcA